jgi:hypothetical protein
MGNHGGGSGDGQGGKQQDDSNTEIEWVMSGLEAVSHP